MKPLLDQNHYEALEVPRDATPVEIERAYRIAQGTYAQDSLAGYSVFEERDAAVMRERVETAYRVLSDEEARREYDAMLAEAGDADASDGIAPEPAPTAGREAAVQFGAPDLPEFDAPDLHEFDELDEGDAALEYDGPTLRRARLHRGIEIEEIAGTTKINPTYLRFIEDERFTDLPAAVYVRGFVTAYAKSVGLDPERVAATYMRRYEAGRAEPRRARRRR